MTLHEWLESAKVTPSQFSATTGLTRATVSRLRRGLHRPTWATVGVIERATSGAVTANDWAARVSEPAE